MKETLNKLKELSFREFRVPFLSKLETAVSSFSAAERLVFAFLAFLLLASGIGVVWKLNNELVVEVPAKGGTLEEGVVGFPRFLNPLLSISETDKDLSSLVYSGLMRVTRDGQLKPDLAESFEISEDGMTYTFRLKPGLLFHDGYPVTSADVLFTVSSVQDETLKSPKRPNWIGVAAEAPDERTVVFRLKQSYAPFLENTTLGILPKHIWGELGAEQFPFSQFNVEPVGSGPYKVSKISRNSSGLAERYELRSFRKFALGEPYISGLSMRFYPNEKELLDALGSGKVDIVSGISPEKAKILESSGFRIERVPLTRIFGVFFNQNQASVLANKEVREALDVSARKSKIVNEVLFGYGTTIDGPIPPGIAEEHGVDAEDPRGNSEEAAKILSRNGWKLDETKNIWIKKTKKGSVPLQFSVSTGDAPELKQAADILREVWTELGAAVDVKIFETGVLNQNIIRPRKYDALLFGEVIGRDLDLFAFWHSSQRNDPGLNVALYANIVADKLLESARSNFESSDRAEQFKKFVAEIKKDRPAVFLYSPDFIYVLPEKVRGFSMRTITMSSERFSAVNEWYVKTDKVWEFFTK